jgi:hypothetical protein
MQQQQQQPQQPTVPATVDDVNEDMMKQILGSMYKDREYLEKFLDESGKYSLHTRINQ